MYEMSKSRILATALLTAKDGDCAPIRSCRLIKEEEEKEKGQLEPCRLYIGSIGAASNRAGLEKAGITHVVTVGDNICFPFHEEKRNDGSKRFTCLRIEVLDQPKDSALLGSLLEETVEWISNALESDPVHRILVHCFQGKSRSATVIAAFLIATTGASVEEALDTIRQTRPRAQPNPGFGAQLRIFRKNILRQS